MTGRQRRRIVLDDEPGVYRIGSTGQPHSILYIDARPNADLSVGCLCEPWDECLLGGNWQSLVAPVIAMRSGSSPEVTLGVLERGSAHTFLISHYDEVHTGGTWLVQAPADDVARVTQRDVPRTLPYIPTT